MKVPFNAISSCIRNGIAWLKGHVASSPALPSDKSRNKLKVKMKIWWNDIDSGKPKYTEKILSQYHFVRQNLIWTRPESNSDLRVWRLVAKRMRRATTLKTEVRPCNLYIYIYIYIYIFIYIYIYIYIINSNLREETTPL